MGAIFTMFNKLIALAKALESLENELSQVKQGKPVKMCELEYQLQAKAITFLLDVMNSTSRDLIDYDKNH